MNCPTCQAPNDDRAAACGACGAALAVPLVGPGFLLASRYEIGSSLGKGGMGIVWKAHDRLLAETVAIKLLRADADDEAELGQRFIAELKLARTVSHRNVCRIHEYGEDRGLRYISMAFVDGVDLKRHLRQRGTLPIDDAFRLCIAIAEGLDAIHEEGIVHRDLKPQNVMIDGRGQPRLMDFGIAKQTEATSGLTDTGKIVGTPEYMSPEQVRAQKLDRRSDVYALGVLVHEVFTGTAPFKADTPVGVLMKHLQEPPSFDLARLPGPLVPILQRALAKNRDERYPTAREMGRALEAARAQAAATAVTAKSAPTLQATGEIDALPPETTALPSEERTAPGGTRSTVLPIPAPVAVTAVPRTVVVPPRPRFPWAPLVLAAAVGVAAAVFMLRRAEPEPVATPVTVAALPPTTVEAAPPTTVATAEAALPTMPPAVAVPQVRPTQAPPTTLPVAPRPDPEAAHRAETAARVADLLRRAQVEALASRYAAAIALYNEALTLDPSNGPAQELLTATLKAQLAAQTASARPEPAAPAGRLLVAGQSTAHAPEGGKDKAFTEGFEAPAGMEVTRESTAAAMPGRLLVTVDPQRVKAGDEYTLKVSFQNTGDAPISIASMTVTNSLDGRRVTSAVPPVTRVVAPRQTAPLLSIGRNFWSDVRQWSWSVQVKTANGETYTNQIVAQ